MNRLTSTLICAALITLSGCKSDFSFGNDVELSGVAFGKSELGEISTLTGIKFPPGAEGLEYLYLGSGIDDALAAKVKIPASEVEEFKTNAVFTTGSASKVSIQIGRSKAWWRIDELTDRVDRTLKLPNATFLEVTCGKEGDDVIVYLSWITT